MSPHEDLIFPAFYCFCWFVYWVHIISESTVACFDTKQKCTKNNKKREKLDLHVGTYASLTLTIIFNLKSCFTSRLATKRIKSTHNQTQRKGTMCITSTPPSYFPLLRILNIAVHKMPFLLIFFCILFFSYSCSSLLRDALGLSTLTSSCRALLIMAFRFLAETLCAISAANFLLCISRSSNSSTLYTKKR